ncbi:helix-turn-helix domain-containing protein [Hyphobacterium sp.]|uniref:helix-turn-helix domain-containing protein n=1 Tax=Hyphobacterium sp. TaxID=2004662 RepID=UPI003B52A2DD
MTPRRDYIFVAAARGREPAEILEEVAARHGVTVRQLTGQQRQKSIVMARRDAIRCLASEPTPAGRYRSLPQIGRLMNRDHTTIVHHVKSLTGGGIGALRRDPGDSWGALITEVAA